MFILICHVHLSCHVSCFIEFEFVSLYTRAISSFPTLLEVLAKRFISSAALLPAWIVSFPGR